MERPKAVKNQHVFYSWCIALAVFWTFMNWPERTGLGGIFYHAGFPFSFSWGLGVPEHFDSIYFFLDIAL